MSRRDRVKASDYKNPTYVYLQVMYPDYDDDPLYANGLPSFTFSINFASVQR